MTTEHHNRSAQFKKYVFTPTERKCFLNIIKKYNPIIENKDTDRETLVIKNSTWNQIASEFNDNSDTKHQATSRQLRRLWANLKQRQREIFVKNRHHTAHGAPAPTDGFNMLEKECNDRNSRANEKHNIEMEILQQQLREAKAKADIAELNLRRQQVFIDTTPMDASF